MKRNFWSSLAIYNILNLIINNYFYLYYGFINSHPILNIKHVVLFQTEDIEIFIDFFFDKTTAVFYL